MESILVCCTLFNTAIPTCMLLISMKSFLLLVCVLFNKFNVHWHTNLMFIHQRVTKIMASNVEPVYFRIPKNTAEHVPLRNSKCSTPEDFLTFRAGFIYTNRFKRQSASLTEQRRKKNKLAFWLVAALVAASCRLAFFLKLGQHSKKTGKCFKVRNTRSQPNKR